MIYTVENTAKIGRRIKWVVDAAGTEYHRCIRIDTETGEVTYYKTDGDGKLISLAGRFLIETVRGAPPITVEFKESTDGQDPQGTVPPGITVRQSPAPVASDGPRPQ